MTEIEKTWLTNCTNTTNPAYYNDYRCLAIFYGRTIAASLSIAGCCLVLFMIVIYRQYRNFTHRMIISVLLPTIVITSVYSYQNNINRTGLYCQVSGFLDNFCTLSQRLLILCIVIHLLVFTIYEKRPKHLELIFHSIVWPFSLCMSIIPIYGHHYGAAGTWCWIKNETRYENLLRLLCVYLWLMMSVFIEIVCFAMVISKIHWQLKQFRSDGYCSMMRTQKKRLYRKYVYPLLLYPLVNFVIAVPVSVNRFQNWLSPDSPMFGLYFLHCTLYPLWGFCNAVMYFMSKDTLRQLHPCAILDEIFTSWARNTASLEPSSTQTGDLPYVDEHYADDSNLVNANASAVLSGEMNSSDSDMESLYH